MTSPLPLVFGPRQLRRATWLIAALWTLAVAASMVWNARLLHDAMFEAAVTDARNDFNMDVLCLTNPANMTRQVHDLEARADGMLGHITSLKPLRPENAPDAWEAAALRAFEQGRAEVMSREPFHGQPHLRLMKPLVMKAACLECHADKGYKVGEIGGGISVTVPLDPYLALAQARIWHLAGVHAGLWALGVLGIFLGGRQIRQRLDQQLRAEKVLRRSETQFRSVWESSGDGMRLTDGQGVVLLVNQAYCEMAGKTRSELEGQSLAEIYAADQRPHVQQEYLERYARRDFQPHRERQQRLWNGKDIWLAVSTSLLDLDQPAPMVLDLFRDITKARRMEKVQSCLSHLAYQLSLLNDAPLAARLVADAAQDLLGWDACFLRLRSPDLARVQSMFNMDTVEGRRVEVPAASEPPLPGPMEERVMRDGAQIILRSSESDGPPDLITFGNTGRRSASLLFVPLRHRSQYLGLFSIQSYRVGAYDRAALDLLQTLADHAAGALERLRAEQEREKFIGELKAALAQVKTLGGLLPICAGCKKIRDDKGYWSQVELYIQKHSEATFTHGLCPECIAKYYPELEPDRQTQSKM